MRDIIRDAAIMTLAQEARQRCMPVKDLVAMYPESKEDILDLLSEFLMIEQKSWERDVWDEKYLTERFVYYWTWTKI